jgi:cysteine-rich repeat protein
MRGFLLLVVVLASVACSGASGGPPVFNAGDSGRGATGSTADASLDAAFDAGLRDTGSGGVAVDAPSGQSSDAAEAGFAGPNCGNGVLDPGEQCDDGNRFNFDGCDSSCRYELVTRMTLLSFQNTPAPAFCTPATNLFGTQAVTSAGLARLNPMLQSEVAMGTTNTLVQFLGLTDLTGTGSGSGFFLGLLSGQLDPAKGTWPGNGPVDWWFLVDHVTVSPTGLPASSFTSAALTAGVITAGPSEIDLPLPLGGSAALLHVSGAHVSATVNATPLANVPAPPPDKLALGLSVFQTITADGTDQGLCGNMTVESLAKTPVPSVLTTGSTACSATCRGSYAYTACGANNPVGPNCNSWLDVLVGGCAVSSLCVAVVVPQQPDVAAGAAVQPLSLGAGNKVASAQSTGNGDGYSAYMKFDLNRAHLTGETCVQTSDCQTGKTCTNGSCQ